MSRPCWWEVAARKKGNPAIAPLHWCSLQRAEVPGFTKVGFAGKGEPFKSGPRKGQARWLKGPEVFEYVSDADVDACREAFEKETGGCAECHADGTVMASWSSTEGVKTRACSICKGTGRAAGGAA